MKKKVEKLLKIILVSLLIINIFGIYNKCYASELDVTNNLEYWNPTEQYSGSIFEDKIDVILSTVQIIGMIVSVISLMVIGIKYMLGSVEEKAHYKQVLMPWLVGAVMVFAITTVPTTIYDLTKGITGTTINSEESDAEVVKGYDAGIDWIESQLSKLSQEEFKKVVLEKIEVYQEFKGQMNYNWGYRAALNNFNIALQKWNTTQNWRLYIAGQNSVITNINNETITIENYKTVMKDWDDKFAFELRRKP